MAKEPLKNPPDNAIIDAIHENELALAVETNVRQKVNAILEILGGLPAVERSRVLHILNTELTLF
jgi:hypothetical protein